MPADRHRVFLLSPADSSAPRARLLLRPEADHDLARRFHGKDGAPLGEVFTFVSSLYFRGKLTYARAFARPPGDGPGVYVITPSDGLRAPESPIGPEDLRRYSRVPSTPPRSVIAVRCCATSRRPARRARQRAVRAA